MLFLAGALCFSAALPAWAATLPAVAAGKASNAATTLAAHGNLDVSANLVALLTNRGISRIYSPGRLDYSVTGDTAGIEQALYQDAGGMFYLLLWQAEPGAAARPLSLDLTSAIVGAVQYEPSVSDSSIDIQSRVSGIDSLALTVPASGPLVVELRPDESCTECAVSFPSVAEGLFSDALIAAAPPGRCTPCPIDGGGPPGGGGPGGDPPPPGNSPGPIEICIPIPDNDCVEQATPATLQNALNNTPCGCQIRLAPGSYGQRYTYTKNCSREQPIVLAGADQFASRFSGVMTMTGNGLIVMQLDSNNGKFNVSGNYNRITRNRFVGSVGRGAIELKGAQNNEIDHNDFSGSKFIFLGFFVYNTQDEVKNTNIHHNYFTGRGGGGAEDIGIYIGGYAAELHRDMMLRYANSLAIVEHNMFENVNMDKTIHIKSNRNVIQSNYFKNSAPADVRQGQYNIMKGNYMDGGFLANHEEYNQFLCNKVIGGNIKIYAGEGGLTRFGTYQSGTSKDVLVSGNDGTLILGAAYGLAGGVNEPALRTKVQGHTGNIVEEDHRDTILTPNATPVCQAPGAPPVQRAQVGLNAPQDDCPAAP